jgi:alkylated DNA nucleotide flippase Atl1
MSNVNVSFSQIQILSGKTVVAEKVSQIMAELPEGTTTPVIASMSLAFRDLSIYP